MGAAGKGETGEMEEMRPQTPGLCPRSLCVQLGFTLQLGRECSQAQTPFLGTVALICRGLIAWNFVASHLA